MSWVAQHPVGVVSRLGARALIQRAVARVALLAAVGTLAACLTAPAPAQAADPVQAVCTVGGLFSGVLGKICSVATHAGRLLKATQKLLGGHVGGALKALGGASTAVKALTVTAVLASIVTWVTGGAQFVLRKTASVISSTTRPQLQSTWFSSTYWRMAAISALLTLPFLFAAAIQAVIRSDLSLLARSAFGYLPLGMLAVSIAAPVTMLLLSASDELSAVISGASGDAGGRLLGHASFVGGGITAVSGSSLLLLVFGLVTIMATLTLWMELLIRAAAVYVVVLMLPLFFAALVWPARKIWAVRAIELLAALILSKFVIVAVLSLGAAALGHTTVPGVTADLAGATLILLAAASPWALLALLPLHEVTSGLNGLSDRTRNALAPAQANDANAIAQALVRQLPAGPSAEYGPPGSETASDEREAAATEVGRLDDNERPTRDQAPADGGGSTDPAGGAGRGPGEAGSGASGGPRPAGGSGGPAAAGGSGGPSPAGASADPTSAAPGSPVSADPAPQPRQRLPGMARRWQAPNGSWPTIELDAEGLPGAGFLDSEPPPTSPEPPSTGPELPPPEPPTTGPELPPPEPPIGELEPPPAPPESAA